MDLLQLVNSEAGKYLLGIKDNYPIVKVTKNSFTRLIDFDNKNHPILLTDFYISDYIQKHIQPILDKIFIANSEYKKIDNYYEAFLHFSGLQEKRNKYPQIFLTDYNPNTTGDGTLIYVDTSASGWANAKAAGAANQAVQTDNHDANCNPQGSGVNLQRTFLPFDTSSIPDTDTVSAAELRIYRDDSIGGAWSGSGLEVVLTTEADPTSLVAGDWDTIIIASYSSKLRSAFTDDAYTAMVISTPASVVSKTGYTKLAVIDTQDLNNNGPGAGAGGYWQMSAYANPEVLRVTHASVSVKDIIQPGLIPFAR